MNDKVIAYIERHSQMIRGLSTVVIIGGVSLLFYSLYAKYLQVQLTKYQIRDLKEKLNDN